MTVSSSTNRATFLGNGAVTVFPLPFRFFANADIQVSLINDATGVITMLSIGTHYTLVGASLPEQDGNAESVLTVLTAPVIGVSLFVQRVLPITQPTDIVNQGPFLPEIHENVFDRLTMIAQQQVSDISDAAENGEQALQIAEGMVIRQDNFERSYTYTNLGAYGAGLVFTSYNQTFSYLGEFYAPSAGVALPYTTTGAGAAEIATFRSVGDATLRQELNIVNVRSYGAVGDGVTNDSAAFQAAANAAVAYDYQLQKSPVTKASVTEVVVPNGDYILNSAVTSQKQIVWTISSGAKLDESKLTGTVNRTARHVNSKHTGILENATTLSLRAGAALSDVGGVYGITTLDKISEVGPPHSVTLQTSNDTNITVLTLTGTTYTSTSVVYTNTLNLADVKMGASITSLGSPKHTGIITAFNQGSKTITLDGGWRPFTGVAGATGTPVNGVSAQIDYFDKVWGQNTNVSLRLGSTTTKMAGYEMGLLNYQADSPAFNPAIEQTPTVWGYDAVNLGTFKSSVAFVARAGAVSAWRTGFGSYGNEIGFQVLPKAGFTTSVGFSYDAEEGAALLSKAGGLSSIRIGFDGNVELGRQDIVATNTLDMHSSGVVNDFDVRLSCTGGSAAVGTGAFGIRAASIDLQAASTRPEADSTRTLGQIARRWLDVYSVNFRPGAGTVIWTSGAGSPEGVVTSPVGGLYTNTSGGASTTLFVKQSGTGNTGWVAK
jgi:hypothetical protein